MDKILKHKELRIASNEGTHPEVLRELAKSERFFIRGAVIYNPNSPADVLEILSNDPHPYVIKCLRLKELRRALPKLKKADYILGKNIRLRNAVVDDASFIVSLRTNLKKARFISETSDDISLQEKWLSQYVQNDEQVYFIIENLTGDSLGTVRLYDAIGLSFCWGSWILKDNLNPLISFESAVMVYCYALHLGFLMAHFDVRKNNTSVNKFHRKMGAICVSNDYRDNDYVISSDEIEAFLKKYEKFTPISL